MRRTLIGLTVVAFLAGCAGSSASVATQLQVAQNYVAVAKVLAASYAALPRCATGPITICSDQSIVDGITKAEQVADEALAQAQEYVNDGSDAERIQTLLRVAMNAVLLFYSFKA